MDRSRLIEPIHIRKTARVEPGEYSEIQLGKMPARIKIEGCLREKNAEPFNYLFVNEENYIKIMGNKKRFAEIERGVDDSAYKIDINISSPDNYFLLLGSPPSSCARTFERTVMIDLEISEDQEQVTGTPTFSIPRIIPKSMRETRKATSSSDQIRTIIELQAGEYEVIPLGQLSQHDSIKGLLVEEDDEMFDYLILDEKNHSDYIKGVEADYIKSLDKGSIESRYKIDKSVYLTDNYFLVIESNAMAFSRTVRIDLAITRHAG